MVRRGGPDRHRIRLDRCCVRRASFCRGRHHREHRVVKLNGRLCCSDPKGTPAGVGEHPRWRGVDVHASPLKCSSAPVNSYRVTVSNGAVTKQCSAPVYFEPNCIIRGLKDHEVYWITAQSHNHFGYSVTTDPEFAIPVASWSFSAVTAQFVISQSVPVVVQVTGVLANSLGIYPTSVITVHFGAIIFYCHANPFGECLITIPHPSVGSASIYATYPGYGRSYRSPTSHVTVTP